MSKGFIIALLLIIEGTLLFSYLYINNFYLGKLLNLVTVCDSNRRITSAISTIPVCQFSMAKFVIVSIAGILAFTMVMFINFVFARIIKGEHE